MAKHLLVPGIAWKPMHSTTAVQIRPQINCPSTFSLHAQPHTPSACRICGQQKQTMPVDSLSAKVLQPKEQQTAEESHVQRAGTNASCCTGRNRTSSRGAPSEIDHCEQKLTCLGLIPTSRNRQTALGFPLRVIFHHSLKKGFSLRLTE